MTHSDWPSIFIGLYLTGNIQSFARCLVCAIALFNSSYKYWFFMDVDESINNDESQQRNDYGSLIDGVHTTRRLCHRMSYILTYVRVALATSSVQSILEIPATDEIHMEDRNHGLA